jgi:hypothetical protein
VYYPTLVNLLFFTFAAMIDNLLYFLKGCILSNLEWGSYHTTPIDDDENDRRRLTEPVQVPR